MAAQVEKRNTANGLMTAVNPLAAPEGALVEATNVVINEPNTIEPRRGFDDYFGRHTNSAGRYYSHVSNLNGFHSRDVIDRNDILYWVLTKDSQFALLHNHPQGSATGIAAGINDWYDGLSAISQPGYRTLPLVPYSTLDGSAMPSLQRFRDLSLLTTGNGILRTQSYAFDNEYAGLPKPLQLTAEIAKAGDESVRWLPLSNKSVSTVGFRAVFSKETTAAGITDTDRLVISAPSDRFVLVTSVLPDITAVTAGNTPSFTFASAHGLQIGDQFSIVAGPCDISYKRGYTVTSVTNTTTVVVASTGGGTVTLTGTTPTAADEWTRYMAAQVRISGRGLAAPARLRLYRTNTTTVSTSVGATDPGDEMLEVEDVTFSHETTFNEETAFVYGYDVELGSLLYSNPSQQTISKSNNRPPISAALAQFANHIFYANNRLLPTGEIRLKTTTGLTNGSTVTVTLTKSDGTTTSETYTAGASPLTATKTFQLTTSGTPSQNVEQTIRSLVRVINRTSALVTAGHTSDFNDLPGRFTLTSDLVDSASISLTSSVANLFDPILPTEFKSEKHPNRLYYSKLQQPDHVPALNFFDVGDLNAEITNLVPSDDRLLIVTTQGVYQLSGYGESSFSVQPLDLTIRTVAPRTTVNLEGQVFTLTQSGFSRISGGEIQAISTSIDDEVVKRIRWPNTFQNAFAVADPVRREILVWLPLAENSDRTLGFRFSTVTGAWTRIDREAHAGGFLAAKGDLILALSAEQQTRHKLVVQRQTGSDTDDYRDETLLATLLGQDGGEVTIQYLDFFHKLPQPGWMLEQGSERAIIRSVRKDLLDQYTLTLDKSVKWGGGAVRLYPGIRSKVTPVTFVGGNAAIQKQFSEIAIALKDNTVRQITLGLTTDQTRIEFPLVVDNPSLSFGWGKSPWGKSPFGSPRREEIDFALRSFVPAAANYGRSLKVSFQHDRAGERYQLIEMSVALSPMTERTVR